MSRRLQPDLRAGALCSFLLTQYMALLYIPVGFQKVVAYDKRQTRCPPRLSCMVMSQGLALMAGGIVLGAVAALGLTRLIGNLRYKVSPRDPLAFGVAFLVMTIASVAACFLPAWRATRTDPVLALRD
jgi:hypothetical protein